MNIRCIQDIAGDLSGKKVLLRVDFNAPLSGDVVLSDFRVRAVLPTIQLLQGSGAKVILISHIGRDPKESLAPVANYMQNKLHVPVTFVPALFGVEVEEAISLMTSGDIVLLENLRSDIGEEENSPMFAKMLSEYADVYVNDAFSVSHREHASVSVITKELPSFAGLLLQKEIKNLSLENIEKPFLVVFGGAKFETKAPLIERFLRDADMVYVGGALVHDFFVTKGYEVGRSLTGVPAGEEVVSNKKIIIPTDVVVENGARLVNKDRETVLHNDTIVDIGEKSLQQLVQLSAEARTILWNGPLGKQKKGTETYLRALSSLTARTLIGGGDTVEIIEALGLVHDFSFVSTGGGAMLEYLQKGTLPGIEALKI